MTITEAPAATRTVAAALADALAHAGVKTAFTVPGETVLSMLEALSARRVRVVATRHESAAAFMAEAVGQLTGRPSLVLATRGPGAANLAIALHAARHDSAPLIAIVGQVRRDRRGRESFQEMEIAAAFEPIVKWAAEARTADEAITFVERAISIATRGRPGPVVIAIPEDVFDEQVLVGEGPNNHAEPHPEPDPTLVRKVLHLLTDGHRPLILAGAGVLRARSTDALVRLAELIQVPVVSSWRRPDVFPNEHPLYLGMTGLGAAPTVLARVAEADALLVLGCRLGEQTTFGYRVPSPGTRWGHVDLEPHAALGAEDGPDIAMAADVAGFLRAARRVLGRAAFEATSFDARKAANAADREAFEAASIIPDSGWTGPGVDPGRVVATLRRVLPPETILATDAGDFGLWAARGYRFPRPGTFIGPTSGSMGYGLPAAIAASLARPGRLAVALAGDGGFAMSMAELETAVRERAHVISLVFDNGRYGTIWRNQQQRGGEAGLATDLGRIDFAGVANACGALGISVESDEEFEPALRQALEAGRPSVLHLALDRAWSTPDVAPGSVRIPDEAAGDTDLSAEVEPGAFEVETAALDPELEAVGEAGGVVEPVEAVETVVVFETGNGVAVVDAIEVLAADEVAVVETVEVFEAAEPFEAIEPVATDGLETVEPIGRPEVTDQPAESDGALEPVERDEAEVAVESLAATREFGEGAESGASAESGEGTESGGGAESGEGSESADRLEGEPQAEA